MNEPKPDLQDIQDEIVAFRDERNWKQFHTTKDLLLGLGIEVSELQEHFLWKSDQEIEKALKDKAAKDEIEDELADVLNYLLLLAKRFDVDLLKAARNKIKKNQQKYPVDKAYGSNKKYTKL